jgi:heme/copper-type cytochrome/quinol oxidase subunit 1
MGPLVVAGYGLAVLGLSGAVLAVLTVVLGSGEPAGDDPWSGHTLEWATSSPPAPGNFAEVPMVTSPTPLFRPSKSHKSRVGPTSDEEAS